ncbi:hypothetical protein [Pantoea stewartii]|uniref:hypothetical protein n=1 Tax=Pantoea stewartii TaxID=66269 RepID=UPI0024BEB552|nr:hypothetical protein [Pantoea stewartii]
MVVTALLMAASFSALSEPIMQCGPFDISSSDDGFAHINGQRPETQKFTFLKAKDNYSNVKYQWMLPDPNVGRWLGLDYVKRNGKAILNVEVIRKNMDEPRQLWTYDCKRVK